jgi:hypothetical protein
MILNFRYYRCTIHVSRASSGHKHKMAEIIVGAMVESERRANASTLHCAAHHFPSGTRSIVGTLGYRWPVDLDDQLTSLEQDHSRSPALVTLPKQ